MTSAVLPAWVTGKTPFLKERCMWSCAAVRRGDLDELLQQISTPLEQGSEGSAIAGWRSASRKATAGSEPT